MKDGGNVKYKLYGQMDINKGTLRVLSGDVFTNGCLKEALCGAEPVR